MMSKCCVICLILFWEVCQKADAQIWSKNDSIRLANILSGKDTFRINPEFQRDIHQYGACGENAHVAFLIADNQRFFRIH